MPSLILGALAFVFVFSYLAANFNYPDILDGTAAEVLPRLRDGGSAMRAVWDDLCVSSSAFGSRRGRGLSVLPVESRSDDSRAGRRFNGCFRHVPRVDALAQHPLGLGGSLFTGRRRDKEQALTPYSAV